MTCITCFYQRGAESYLDLADRISYLYKAHQHLQSYLDPSQWGSVSRPYPQTGSWGKSGETNTDAGVLVQSEEQVGRYTIFNPSHHKKWHGIMKYIVPS